MSITCTDQRFGRLKSRDPQDHNYPLRALVNLEEPTRTRPWSAPDPLDQGPTSACTGFSAAHFLAAAPHRHPLTYEAGQQFYTWARKNDEWPGEDYEGSSVRGAMKGLERAGLIRGGYLWAFTAETVRDYVLRYGPVVTGTDWYLDMMEPDSKARIHPTGPMEGGHAWLILGYSADRDAFRMQNSWGIEWGTRGRAWIGFDEYQMLLEADGGEACSPVEVVGA